MKKTKKKPSDIQSSPSNIDLLARVMANGPSVFLANSKRHPLVDHQPATTFRFAHLLLALRPSKEVMPLLARAGAESGIGHDVGKVEASNQDYLSRKALEINAAIEPDLAADVSAEALRGVDEVFSGPYHEELSWMCMNRRERLRVARSAGQRRGEAGSSLDHPSALAAYAVRWHHRTDWRQKKDAKGKSLGVEVARPTLGDIEAELRLSFTEKGRNALDEMEAFHNMANIILKASAAKGEKLFSALMEAQKNDSSATEESLELLANFQSVLSSLAAETPGFKEDVEELPIPPYQYIGKADEDLPSSIARGGQRKLVLFLLIEADRWASSLSKEQLAHLMENPLDPAWSAGVDHSVKTGRWQEMVREQAPAFAASSLRAESQVEVAKKAASFHFSVVEGDTGVGKTSIALLWAAHGEKDRSLSVALPMQDHVINLFSTALVPVPSQENPTPISDLARLAGLKSLDAGTVLTAEAIYGGRRQDYVSTDDMAEKPLLSAEMSFLTWDRLLSPQYERRQFSEFMAHLFSDLVLDELQDLSQLPLMVIALGEVLYMRRVLAGAGRTLLQTATHPMAIYHAMGLGKIDQAADGGFKYADFVHFSPRNLLAEAHQDVFTYLAVDMRKEEWGSDSLETIRTLAALQGVELKLYDLLVSTNTIKDCRAMAKLCIPSHLRNKKFSMLAHSQTGPLDKRQMVRTATAEFGTKKEAGGILFSSLMMIASHQINSSRLVRAAGLPFMDAQGDGRHGRSQGKGDNPVVFVLDDKSKNVFSHVAFGYQRLHLLWCDFLKEKFGVPGGVRLTRRQFMHLYDGFMARADVMAAFLEGLLQRLEGSAESLAAWFPMRSGSSKGKNGGSIKKGGFRERSYPTTAMAMDLQGNAAGHGGHLPKENLLSASWGEASALRQAGNQGGKGLLKKCLSKSGYRIESGSFLGSGPEAPLAYSLRNPNTANVHKEYAKSVALAADTTGRGARRELDKKLVYLTAVGLLPHTEAESWVRALAEQEITEEELLAYQAKLRWSGWTKE